MWKNNGDHFSVKFDDMIFVQIFAKKRCNKEAGVASMKNLHFM
jgi:hypothetical protein